MPHFMTREEIDRQHRRAYGPDRLPGQGADRNALGVTGARRLDGRCRTCGEPIVGRPGSATTCLIHREYPGPLKRAEMVALIAEHEAVVTSLRKALAEMDEAEPEGAAEVRVEAEEVGA